MLAPYVEEEYGDRVTLEYHDVDKMDEARFDRVKDVVDSRQYPLPLVAVNGEPVWAGSVELYVLRKVLAERGIHGGK